MDIEAVGVANYEVLEELGLNAKGDILSLKAFCQRHSTTSKPCSDYEERKNKLIDELKKGKQERNRKINQASTSFQERSSKAPISVKKTRKTRKVILGWMHHSSLKQRFVTVRLSNGGGVRQLDVPGDSRKEHLLTEAKKLFFPDGISSFGKACDMEFNLANFKGDSIPENITVENYIDKHKLTKTRLYLTSTPLVTDVDDEVAPLTDTPGSSGITKDTVTTHSLTSTFIDSISDSDDDMVVEAQGTSKKRNRQDKGRAWRMKYANINDDSSEFDSEGDSKSSTQCSASNNLPQLSNSTSNSQLIGTSKEREQMKKEQDDEFQRCLEEDQRKEEERSNVLNEEKEMARLESIRSAKSSRVPPEPILGSPRVRIAVNHLTKDKLVRFFNPNEQMLTVYDWVGSQSLKPENFMLCLSPGQTIQPSDPVTDCTLYMEATDNPVMMCDDDQDIFFKGYGCIDECCEHDTLPLDYGQEQLLIEG